MATFHTCITKTHYSVLQGAQTDLEQYALFNLLGDEMSLISIIVVSMLYMQLPLRLTAKQQQCIFTMKTACQYTANHHT